MEDLGRHTGEGGTRMDSEASGLQGDLLKAAHGEAGLPEAFVTLALCREERARAAAELLEREVWAMTALLEASASVWDELASPTLRFAVGGGERERCHLELGRFAHLEALCEPSQAERALIAAAAPCWARVVPHCERELAGHTGPLACAYEPIPPAEAVAILGFGTIVSQIETAARAAGQGLLAEAQTQAARRARLAGVEQMLGWQSDPAAQDRPLPGQTRVLLALLRPGCGWPLAAVLLALLAIPLCLFVAASYAPLAFVPAILCLVIGICARLVTRRSVQL